MLETYREPWVDFLQIPSLCRRAGCSSDDLALIGAKELIDNGLDVSPTGIEVEFEDGALIVQDRGPGLSEEQALAIFSVKRPSLSSKRWRQARRGALGNGVRVVMGVAHCSGGAVTVESRGVGLVLAVLASGETAVERRFDSEISTGARVSLRFGKALPVDVDEIIDYAELCLCGIGSAFGGTKAVPSWFDATAIRELIRDAAPATSVLAFARNFDLTDDALALIKEVSARTTTIELLADVDRLSTVAATILGGQKGSRKLQRMGRSARDGAYAFAETTLQLGAAAVPAIVECWAKGSPVKNSKTAGSILVNTLFANRTPAIMRKGYGTVDPTTKEASFSFGGWRFPVNDVLKKPCNFTLEFAITAPELPLVSDGKAVDLKPFASAILAVFDEVLRKAYVAPSGKVERAAKSKFLTVKDAVYAVLPEIYPTVAMPGIGVAQRTLMYRCRPKIYELTGRSELVGKTFYAAMNQFVDDNPELTKDWQILCDDRGHFTEPGGAYFGIGTLSVERYLGELEDGVDRYDAKIGGVNLHVDTGRLAKAHNPSHRYSAIVFVEKEGYAELIAKAKIAERFDVAFASTKGVPTTSIRRLLDRLAEFGTKVFVLHDFDIVGMNILNTLVTSNERYQFRNQLDFVDMGVRFTDAVRLGLSSEPFKLNDKTDKDGLRDRLRRYGCTEPEVEMLVDVNRRVEIDAMTTQQLIEFIEGKLEEHGIGKIVPSVEAMAPHYQKAAADVRAERVLARARQELAGRLDEIALELRRAVEGDIYVPDLTALVRERLEANRDLTWPQAVAAIALEAETSATAPTAEPRA